MAVELDQDIHPAPSFQEMAMQTLPQAQFAVLAHPISEDTTFLLVGPSQVVADTPVKLAQLTADITKLIESPPYASSRARRCEEKLFIPYSEYLDNLHLYRIYVLPHAVFAEIALDILGRQAKDTFPRQPVKDFHDNKPWLLGELEGLPDEIRELTTLHLSGYRDPKTGENALSVHYRRELATHQTA